MYRYFWTILILFSSTIISGQIEICDNAFDDDGDGLVDINDPDCICPETVPSGLIPNPSFEGMLCCPSGEQQLNCAESWIQASSATSDYYHTCGITEHPFLNGNYATPMPIPDGDGWVGFRDGKPGNPQFKEYVGACLNQTMEVGKTYRIDFFVGFPNNTSFTGIDMTFFAHEDCSAIPFGGNNSSIGCPTNVPGWTELKTEYVEGRDEWINLVVDFTADKPYNVFVLGPNCVQHPDFTSHPYFFVDRLALAETNEFDVPFANIEGDVCGDEIILTADFNPNYTYQWYNDGVAIIGETSSEIIIPVDESSNGTYLLAFGEGTACFYSEEYELEVPQTNFPIEAEICDGGEYNIAGQMLTETDIYTFFLFSSIGCDSIIEVDLTVNEVQDTAVVESICEGLTFSIAGDILSESGEYFYSLTNVNDCDSMVTLNLTVNENFETSITPRICQGEVFPFEGDDLTLTGTYPYNYQSQTGCDSTVEVRLIVLNAQEVFLDTSICQGEIIEVGTQEFMATGIYNVPLFTQEGCDSLVMVDLTVNENTVGAHQGAICDGEAFDYLGQSYTEAGSYMVQTLNTTGCDSSITLTVEVIDRADGIQLEEEITVSLGDEVTIEPVFIEPVFINLEWLNGGIPIESIDNSVTISPLTNTTLSLTGTDALGCMDSDEIQVRVSRDIGIYAPNIFSPNGDTSNDTWKIIVTKSIASLDRLVLYDRWGNLIYSEESITDINTIQGWDGRYNGTTAEQGVYVYRAEYTALDGITEFIVGDVTLMR